MALPVAFVHELETGPSPYKLLPELAEFCACVTDAIPGTKTFARSATSAWVYNPHDIMPIGIVSYDHRTKRHMQSSYIVRSNTIQNRRYAIGTDNRNTVASKNMLSAVKLAVQWLIPVTPQAVSNACIASYTRVKGDKRKDYTHQRLKAEGYLLGHPSDRLRSPLIQELTKLMADGHEFSVPGLADSLREYINLCRTEQSCDVTAPVRVIQVRQNTVTVGIHNNPSAYSYSPIEDLQHYRPEEVPQHIAERIAVLNMVGTNVYVNGVGVKATEGVYFADP